MCLLHQIFLQALSDIQLTLKKDVEVKDITLMHWRRVALQPASTYKLASESD